MKTKLGNIWKEKLKKDVLIARLMVIVMLIYIVLPLMPDNVLANTDDAKVKTLFVSVDKTEGLVGEVFKYQIKYSFSSNNVLFEGEQIIAKLPDGMVISDYDYTEDIIAWDKDDDDSTNFVNGSTITFPVKSLTGITGTLSFSAYYPIGSLNQDKDVAVIVTGGDKDSTIEGVTDPRVDPVVTMKLKDIDETNDMTVTKTVASPYNTSSVKPIPGSEVTYIVTAYGVQGNGAYNISNVDISDTLPKEAVYVSHTDSSGDVLETGYDSDNHSVSWTVGDLGAESSYRGTVTVRYPIYEEITEEVTDGDGVTTTEVTSTTGVKANDTIINYIKATGTADPNNKNINLAASNQVSITFDQARPDIKDVSKSARGKAADTSGAAAEYSIDETIQYKIYGFGNDGNVPLDTMVVYDELPDEIDLESISAPGAISYYALEEADLPSDNEIDFEVTTTQALVLETQSIVNKVQTALTEAQAAALLAHEIADEAVAAQNALTDDSTDEEINTAAELVESTATEASAADELVTSLIQSAADAAQDATDAGAYLEEVEELAALVAAPDYRKYDWQEYDSQNNDFKSAIALKFVYSDVNVGQSLSDITLTANFVEGITANMDQTYENIVYTEGFATNYDLNDSDYDSSESGSNSDFAYIKCVDDLPNISFSKRASVSQVKDGERISYTLTFRNSRNATGTVDASDSFTIFDNLPEDVNPVFKDLRIDDKNGFSVKVNDSITEYNQSEETDNSETSTVNTAISSINFSLTGITLARNESHSITYSVLVPKGTVVGSYENTAKATFTDTDADGKVGTRTNPDSLEGKKASVFVKFTGSLGSIKGVGYNIYTDAGHTAFLGADGTSTLIEDSLGNELISDIKADAANVGEEIENYIVADYENIGSDAGSFAMPIATSIVNVTLPGGVVRYRLEVSNEKSNGPISNIVLIDKLPKKGDEGVIVNSSRGSGWSPYLVSGITLSKEVKDVNDETSIVEIQPEIIDEDENIKNFTVFYSTAEEPSYSQLNNPEETYTGDHGDWTINLPENITDVTHIKIQIKEEFEANDNVLVEWNMKAPYDVPETIVVEDKSVANIAWNSFAYAATYESIDSDNNTILDKFLPAEPIKVGVRVGNDSLSTLDGAIGNFIWHDENGNGIQDTDEKGINDIKVKLYYNGTSVFTAEDDDANSLDINEFINDNHFLEETYTGPNDDGEPGFYYFPNLGAGHYIVEFEMPEGFYITTAGSKESDEAVDSDFEKVTKIIAEGDEDKNLHRSNVIELSETITGTGDNEIHTIETNEDIDAGIYRKVSLGDYVWDDYDNDGIQDDGEPGVEGVSVSLYKDNISIRDNILTDPNGYYEIKELDPGEQYSVRFELYKNESLSNYTYTEANKTSVENPDSKDSDGIIKTINISENSEPDNKVVAETEVITLLSNNSIDPETGTYYDLADDYLTDDTVDQGIRKGAIGNYVWNDYDVDGIQGSDEPGLKGITVSLLEKSTDSEGIVTYSLTENPAIPSEDYIVTTDTNGKYLFTRLNAGTYKVKFTIPENSRLRPSKHNTPGDDTLDSDGDLSEFTTGEIVITSGSSDLTNDMGFYYPGTVGDLVWEDMNGDGIRNTYYHDHDLNDLRLEPGINDVTVELFYAKDEDGLFNDLYDYTDHVYPNNSNLSTITTSTIEDIDGLYSFDDLYFDTYKIVVTKPSGLNGYDQFTLINQGADDSKDSDADADGYIGSATIGTTNYIDDDYDAGLYNYGSIGNRVWVDTNMNGIQDDGDSIPAIVEDIKVTLTGKRNVDPIIKYTDASGNYKFEGLAPDTYTLVFTMPDNYSISQKDQSDGDDTTVDDTIDSDATIDKIQDSLATISNIVLYSGEDNIDCDLGIYKSFSLGDFVWQDMENDGIQNNVGDLNIAEAGIANVDLILYIKIGNGGNEVATTTTDADGGYGFGDLPLGDYYIEVLDSVEKDGYPGIDIDKEYEIAKRNQGSDDLKDNDADAETNKTDTISFTTDTSSAYHDSSLDIGIYKYISIGNYVWVDLDYDGIQDAVSESGIAEVEVGLYDSDGNYVWDKTDSDGEYLFDQVSPDTYEIVFIIPEGYTATDSDKGLGVDRDLYDSDGITDANSSTILSKRYADSTSTVSGITVKSGDVDLSYDLGVYESFSLGDRTWLDKDGDGFQDTDEVEDGVGGITLSLYKYDTDSTTQIVDDDHLVQAKNKNDALVEYVVSASDGSYRFYDLPKGDYFVIASTGAYNMTNINVKQGETLDISNDSNFEKEMITVESPSFSYFRTLNGEKYSFNNDTKERDNLTVDAGVYKLAGIGNFVWEDLDYNGLRDDEEPGIENVIVNLYNSNYDGVYKTQKTTNNGEYFFKDIEPGVYTIEFEIPESYFVTLPNVNGETSEAIDSDAIKDNDSAIATINYGQVYSEETIINQDLGLYRKAKVGDYVWKDNNKNGIQDGDEGFLGGIVVEIFRIEDNNGVDELVNPYDASELSEGNSATDITDANGIYEFSNLRPGDYKIVFSLGDDNVYSVTQKDANENKSDDKDSDGISNGSIDTEAYILVTVTSGKDNITLDLGLYDSFKLGDLVFEDMNGNGIHETDEPGVSDVKIYLYDDENSSSPIADTITNSDGEYEFTDLSMGTYFVKVMLKDTYVFTTKDVGANSVEANVKDSDVTTSGENVGISESVTFNTGSPQENNDLDAGMYVPSTLGDYVWLDSNRNGIQEASETTGIDQVKVYLYEKDTVPVLTGSSIDYSGAYQETRTDASGAYEFTGITPGDYYVIFTDLPENYVVSPIDALGTDTNNKDSDGDVGDQLLHTSAQTINFSIKSNQKVEDIDLGLYPGFSLGDMVWFDSDADGLYADGLNEETDEPEEHGISGISLELYKEVEISPDSFEFKLVDTKVTNASGNYLFEGLPVGKYYVKLLASPLYVPSEANVGNNDVIDSDFDILSRLSNTHEFLATSIKDENIDIDAGLYELVGIGDRVWIDKNYNGIQDPGEDGKSGVSLTLFQNGLALEDRTVVTDADGIYAFAGLDPGIYNVGMTIPEGYKLTKTGQGNDHTIDSNGLDDNSDISMSDDIEITSVMTSLSDENTTNNTVDFGVYEFASIGDLVFHDKNRDGLQDANEGGIEGINVKLIRVTDHKVIASDRTDEKGKYEITDIYPDDYYIEFSDIPSGYSITVANKPGDEINSDATIEDNGNIRNTYIRTDETVATTGTLTINSGVEYKDVDLGLYSNFSIGNYVWLDAKNNGLQETSDLPKSGMEMYLYLDGDIPGNVDPLKTVTTNEKGEYLFDNLAIGSYYILANVGDYLVVDMNQGSGENDSDFGKESYQSSAIIFTDKTSDDDSYNDSIDLGVYKLAGLGDRIWTDKNYNGIQDSNENGFSNIQVSLFDSEGKPVKNSYGTNLTDTTDFYGKYNFDSLEPGKYNVEFKLPDDSYYLTKPGKGGDIELDSEGNILGDVITISNYELFEGESITSLDVGVYQLGSIEGYMWLDTNKDGLQNNDELPVTKSMTVELSGVGITKTMSIGEDGKYIFEDLVPGTYTVKFIRISNYRMSPANIGKDDTIDSDADLIGIVDNIVLVSGEHRSNIDAGIYYSSRTEVVVTPTPEVVVTPTPEVEITPTPSPEVEITPTPSPVVEITPTPQVTPTPVPDTPTPPTISELKPQNPTIDLPEENTPEERIFVVDEEVDDVTVIKEPDHGAVVVDEENNIIYTPGDTFKGVDQIVVLIEDDEDDFIMEIDIFEEDIAESQLAELPATSGIPTLVYCLFGSIVAMAGIVFKKKQ